MVGEIRGTDALLAIVEHEGEVRAYACNGEERISEWFEGKVDRNGDLELENAAGSTLRATQVDGVFQGDVKLAGGERHDFDGEAMQGPAGMFRVRGEEAELDGIKAGWILDNEGRERGAVQRKGTFERAPGLPANGLRLGGKTYPVFSFDFPTPELPSPAGPIPIPYPNTP